VPASDPKLQKLWGLIEYKPQWSLTCRGWLLIVMTVALTMLFVLTQIHSFLCISAPNGEAEVLVVEGWLNDEALKGAKAEFARGNYRFLMTTGDPLSRGFYLSKYQNFAELSAATLKAIGVDEQEVVAIPCRKVTTHRTYACAQAVRESLSNSTIRVRAINLYSFDTHARRSWLIYQQMLAPRIQVGIVAFPSSDYQPHAWWASSEGFRSVISEALAYLYVRLRGNP
jgi:hypothetical protein